MRGSAPSPAPRPPASPPSCPHAAISSPPREARSITTQPLCRRTARKACVARSPLGAKRVPGCGLKPIRLTLQRTRASRSARRWASASPSFTPRRSTYCTSTWRPARCASAGNSSSSAATSSRSGCRRLMGTSQLRTSSVVACRDTASAARLRAAKARISGTRPTCGGARIDSWRVKGWAAQRVARGTREDRRNIRVAPAATIPQRRSTPSRRRPGWRGSPGPGGGSAPPLPPPRSRRCAGARPVCEGGSRFHPRDAGLSAGADTHTHVQSGEALRPHHHRNAYDCSPQKYCQAPGSPSP
ncbi:hypothetical protein F751_0966 [Auxenochlorella protothecoides]|uniref:Uncharacterized protein n=1 Tax=Auxenochlorella protothecoides TaxID=3075 RepID=A0A087SQZ7_AUXPR|nr:hypothetical protein F751_0966 [Auxenochlorella protothecoides]KFM28151.1 hypothetical protein F751_0966 [Auxenochlorella protothecoides]